MAMLEALLLMAAQPAAPPVAAKPAPPPTELLEFLGDWSEEEGQLIDAEHKRAAGAGTPGAKGQRPADGTGGKQP